MEIYVFIIHKAFFFKSRILSFFLRSFFFGDSPVSVTQKGGHTEVEMIQNGRLSYTAFFVCNEESLVITAQEQIRFPKKEAISLV